MEERIRELICEVLKTEPAKLAERMDDSTVWDSLLRVEVLFAIEEEYDILFEQDELKTLDTPQKLFQAAMKKAGKL